MDPVISTQPTAGFVSPPVRDSNLLSPGPSQDLGLVTQASPLRPAGGLARLESAIIAAQAAQAAASPAALPAATVYTSSHEQGQDDEASAASASNADSSDDEDDPDFTPAIDRPSTPRRTRSATATDAPEPDSPERKMLCIQRGVRENCTHKKTASDPHRVCEACKFKDGTPLCTLARRCQECYAMSHDAFYVAVLAKRFANRRKTERKKKQSGKHESTAAQAVGDDVDDDDDTSPLSAPQPTFARPPPPMSAVAWPGTGTPIASTSYASTSTPRAATASMTLENASLCQLFELKMQPHTFCEARGLHPDTVASASGSVELCTLPLREVSARLHTNPTRRDFISGTSATPAAPVEPLPDLQDLENVLSDSDLSLGPSAASSVSKSDDDASPLGNENAIRSLIEFVAAHSLVEARAPVESKPSSDIRAAVQQQPGSRDRLALTSARVVVKAIAARDAQMQRVRASHRAGHVSALSDLTVKMPSYTPADDVLPLKAPTLAKEGATSWLTPLSKNAPISVATADVISLEEAMRSLVAINSSLDSAFYAFRDQFANPGDDEPPMYAALVEWIGHHIRDNVKLAVFAATSLTQARRDAVLRTSRLDEHERDTLRFLPVAHATSMFPQPDVAAAIASARRRTADDKDEKLTRLVT